MTHDDIIAYCLIKPGAYIDHPFGEDVTVIKVKNRIFAQVFTKDGEPLATFNCDLLTGGMYRAAYPGSVTRGYHCPPVQQPYFNTVKLDESVPTAILLQMIDHSYTRVVRRMPRADRLALQAEFPEN